MVSPRPVAAFVPPEPLSKGYGTKGVMESGRDQWAEKKVSGAAHIRIELRCFVPIEHAVVANDADGAMAVRCRTRRRAWSERCGCGRVGPRCQQHGFAWCRDAFERLVIDQPGRLTIKTELL